MKEFYSIDDLQVNVRLNEISSYKLEYTCKNTHEKKFPKCCVILKSGSVYWCDEINYYNLNNLFF